MEDSYGGGHNDDNNDDNKDGKNDKDEDENNNSDDNDHENREDWDGEENSRKRKIPPLDNESRSTKKTKVKLIDHRELEKPWGPSTEFKITKKLEFFSNSTLITIEKDVTTTLVAGCNGWEEITKIEAPITSLPSYNSTYV